MKINSLHFGKTLSAVVAASFLLFSVCHAQSASDNLSAQQIIDALKPSEQAPANRELRSVRGIRNLGVKQSDPLPPVEEGKEILKQSNQRAIDLAIQFEFDSSKISPASEKILHVLSVALASPELRGLHFRIEGHTDNVGTAQYNQKLSLQRAEEVKRILIANRINPDQLVTEGKGFSEPANHQDLTAAENRRVRIVNIAQ